MSRQKPWFYQIHLAVQYSWINLVILVWLFKVPNLILYKYSFQVDGRRIFCQSQPFPCSYERLFFVLCQYSLVLADITVDTVVSTELQWENLSHFISQTRLEDSKAKFQTSLFLDAKHEKKWWEIRLLFMTVECIFHNENIQPSAVHRSWHQLLKNV